MHIHLLQYTYILWYDTAHNPRQKNKSSRHHDHQKRKAKKQYIWYKITFTCKTPQIPPAGPVFPTPRSMQKPPVILVAKPDDSSKTTDTHSGAASTRLPLGGYSCRHVVSCHAMWCDVMWCHVGSCHEISYHVMRRDRERNLASLLHNASSSSSFNTIV